MDAGDSAPGETEFGRIMTELRMLRRSPLHTFEDFTRAPTILWHLGRGNVDVAAAFFRHLAAIEDNHVQAAIALINPRPEVTLEDRMNEFALDAGADSTRTVRRWADEGFRIVAQLILDWSAEEGNDRPLVEVSLAPHGGDAVLIQMTGTAQPGRGQMLPPEIRSSGAPLAPLEEDASEVASLLPDQYMLHAVAHYAADDDQRSIVMRWLGNTGAYFKVTVLPGVMPAWVVTVLMTQRGCEVRWEPVD